MTSPRVTLTLDGHGALALVLPGPEGGERHLPLRAKDLDRTLMRVLQGLAQGASRLGEAGSPTISQAQHWVRHEIFKDHRCPFCVDELRDSNIVATNRQRLQKGIRALGGGATVRHCAPGESGIPPRERPQRSAVPVATTKRTAAQLGL